MDSDSAAAIAEAAWDPAADLLAPIQVAPTDGATTPTTVFLCRFPGCGRHFQLKGNLKRHQNIHRGDKQFHCDVCGRSFLRKADMEVHARVHTGEKPYACQHPDCDKRFARRSDLLSHERTHSGSKPYACENPGCGRRFARRFDLHKHARSHDTDDDSKAEKKPAMKRRLTTATAACQKQTPTEDKDKLKPISPTDHSHGPGEDVHYELTCTEDHVHTSPECFSIEELDALLGTTPAAPCCPEHLHSITEAFAAAHAHAQVFDTFHQSMGVQPLPLPRAFSLEGAPSATDAMTAQLSATSLNPPCPVAATAKLHDYAAHTACGHLAIQHGDHRDFVVKNHLVCVDSVKSLTGDCGGAHASACAKPALPPRETKCAPQDPHRPGCGHLAVRHGDHIDYVVEDNLFCQLAGGLMEEAGNIELLDDDFWEFYGAIGSLKTE